MASVVWEMIGGLGGGTGIGRPFGPGSGSAVQFVHVTIAKSGPGASVVASLRGLAHGLMSDGLLLAIGTTSVVGTVAAAGPDDVRTGSLRSSGMNLVGVGTITVALSGMTP